MMSGKVTREFVLPKCDRGEFGHHAQRQASIDHSHRIYAPTRLQGTRRPAARVIPNRPSLSPPIAHRCQRKPLPSYLVPLFGDQVPDTFSLDMYHPFPMFTHHQRKPAPSHLVHLFRDCSLGVSHPLPTFTHHPSARLVRVVVRPTSCTAVKAHVPTERAFGSRHRPAARGGHISEPRGSAYLRGRLPGTPPHLWARCLITNDKCPPIGPSSEYFRHAFLLTGPGGPKRFYGLIELLWTRPVSETAAQYYGRPLHSGATRKFLRGYWSTLKYRSELGLRRPLRR